MKKSLSRVLTVVFIVLGVFIIAALTVFFLSHTSVLSKLSLPVRSLVYGGVVALLVLPVLLFFILRNKSLSGYSVYALEDLELNEAELNDAVANWVFSKYRKHVEEDVQFLENEDGSVSCRVKVREE
ncbi:MAG: hypothetical protein CSA76_03480 [Spirochaetales bacterium]|nr:MAG: hypothetical protein CSA76_03480 [Spirochaetales bacterium]